MNNIGKILKKYIRTIENNGINVKKVILFGSYAKGTARDYSDIDVCIVSDNLGRDYFDEMVKLSKLAISIDARIEPVPFTPSDLEDKYNTLAQEIKRYGKVIV